MYWILPLLVAVGMLVPWTGPADPGGRMASANSADGLAEEALVYHEATLSAVRADPGANGMVTPARLPSGWVAVGIASCASGGVVVTSVSVPATVSRPAVAAALGRLWSGYPLVGQAGSNGIVSPLTGAVVGLPCGVPDGTPVVVSEAGG